MLNSFFVPRCTSTLLPLGAPAMSSTAHWPSTVVQPSMPFASKSNLSTGTLSGTLSSSAAAGAGTRGHRAATSTANVVLSIPRRVTFMTLLPSTTRIRCSIELLEHRTPPSPRCPSLAVTGLPHVPRVAQGVASRLRPERETVRLVTDGNGLHLATRRVDDINDSVVAAGQPELFAIDADVTHVRAAGLWN